MTGSKSAKALVGAYCETVDSGRSAEAAREFLSGGVRLRGARRLHGARSTSALGATFSAIRDLVLAIDGQVAEGDAVVTRWTVTGTHRGPLFRIPPPAGPSPRRPSTSTTCAAAGSRPSGSSTTRSACFGRWACCRAEGVPRADAVAAMVLASPIHHGIT